MSYILGLVSQVKQAYLGSLFGLYGEGNISDPDTTKTNPDVTKTTYKRGKTGITTLDMSERLVFGFGNSSENRCASTAHLQIQAGNKPGQLKVHCLDHGNGPLLLSVETLRNLGAVVDFSSDLICFRHLDPCRVIRAERSATGHQLLDMTEDWYKGSLTTTHAVPSLEAFVAKCAVDEE